MEALSICSTTALRTNYAISFLLHMVHTWCGTLKSSHLLFLCGTGRVCNPYNTKWYHNVAFVGVAVVTLIALV